MRRSIEECAHNVPGISLDRFEIDLLRKIGQELSGHRTKHAFMIAI